MKSVARSWLCGAVGLVTAVALVSGCTADEGDASVSAEPTTSAQASAPEPSTLAGGEPMVRSGLSGEIVYVDDGLLQVQDGSSQTAVRYTSDTAVTTQATLSIADVAEGDCVTAVVADDGAATAVTVSEQVDGECAVTGGGFGGGFGGGGMGEMPDVETGDMPEGGPGDGGDFSTMAPESGQIPGDGAGGSFVIGIVTAVGTDGLSIEDTEGSTTEVTVGDDTAIEGTVPAATSDIEVGMCVTATGTADDAGGYDATALVLSEAGDDGCISGAVRGRGQMSGGRDDAGPGRGDEE